MQKRRYLGETLPDIADVKHAALRRQIIREQQLQIAKAGGKQQLPPRRADGHAALTRVIGKDVLLTRRIIELLALGLDVDAIIRQLAEVDFGALDLERRRG